MAFPANRGRKKISMTKINKKIIEGAKHCAQAPEFIYCDDVECPYHEDGCRRQLMQDAIDALEKKEGAWSPVCWKCGGKTRTIMKSKSYMYDYCPKCHRMQYRLAYKTLLESDVKGD